MFKRIWGWLCCEVCGACEAHWPEDHYFTCEFYDDPEE